MAGDLWGLLEEAVDRYAEKTLLKFGEERRSYAEVREASRRAAAGFAALGIGKGDRVCLMLGNRPEYVYAWFGLCRLGAVAVPLNVHLKGGGARLRGRALGRAAGAGRAGAGAADRGGRAGGDGAADLGR